ncbi:MAG: hypothetical protein Q8O84_03965 [Nanoarchaeota archaeon]|nr:hypothetical protein [Nanoarchaeota archaeon]
MACGEELLIFDYTPKLKIVGTHHALNDSDKKTLELLVDQSDFVALEWDEFRAEKEGLEVYIRVSKKKKGYYPEDNTYYARRIDIIFEELLGEVCNRDVIEGAKLSGRNVEENEFTLCQNLCREKRKNVYLVDIPELVLMDQLFAFSTKQKLLAIINLKFFKRFTYALDNLLLEERENYMLNEIEKYEGPINELKRKGILVVGYTHAENYLSKLKNNVLDGDSE